MGVEKALCCTERRRVLFAKMAQQLEALADGCGQLCDIVALDVEAAAFQRAVIGESCQDEMAAGPERTAKVRHVPLAVLGHGKKMKDGTVVPQVVLVLR